MRKLLFLIALVCLAPTGAFAQSSTPTGKISHLWLSTGQNYGFRVYLTNNGTDPLAGCFYDFAYVNTTNDNYQAYVATMLTDYALQKPVLFHMTQQSDGFCVIDEIEG